MIDKFWCKFCEIYHKPAEVPGFTRRQFLSITVADIVALLTYQKGRCAVCRDPICLLKNKAWAVDHDHECCGKGQYCQHCVRGILCGLCNRMLGLGRDQAWILKRGAMYLQNWEGSTKIPLRMSNRISDAELKELYDSGETCAALAKLLGCSAMTVHRRLKLSGIELRKRGTHKR